MPDVLEHRRQSQGRLSEEGLRVSGCDRLVAYLDEDLGVLDGVGQGRQAGPECQARPLVLDDRAVRVARRGDDRSVVSHFGKNIRRLVKEIDGYYFG